MCIQFSEKEIGEAIFWPQGDGAGGSGDDPDMLELADQLLARDVAMWVFAYTIADIYGPGEIADAMRSAVSSHLAEPLLGREQRRELHAMCENLTDPDVPRLFKLSIDHAGHNLQSDPSNLCAVLNELEQFPARAEDELPPIAVFVHKLASAQPPEFGDRLRALIADLVPRKLQADALEKVADGQRGPRRPGRIHYCAIHLEPDTMDSGLYYLSAFIQEGPYPAGIQEDAFPAEPLIEPDDNPCTEDQIRTRIDQALNSAPLSQIRPDELRVEFYLPNSLIDLPVDQWRVGVVALGVRYQVVVRSLTRLRELAGSYRDWQAKWPQAQQADFSGVAGVPDPAFRPAERVTWLTEQAAVNDPEQVYVALVRPDGPVCLVLVQPPAPDRCEALLVALTAGIPVLLWARNPQADLPGSLRGLCPVAGAPLLVRDLPVQALAFRRSASADRVGDDHLARHLTLLYDDASRIPEPAAPFRMPS